MAVTATTKRVSAALRMIEGSDPVTGKEIAHSVNYSGLRGNPDLEKVMNIAEASSPCLTGSLGDVTLTEVKSLERV